MNEFVFIAYVLLVCFVSLVALSLGKEALIAVICLFSVLVNLFVTKKIELFHWSATASDALAVGMTLGLNLLQEYFGKDLALKTIWISFFCSVTYLVFSFLHLLYVPAPDDLSQVYFQFLLRPMPRVIIVSLLVFILVQHLDCLIYRAFYRRFEGKYYLFRNFSSSAITQLTDTVLFTFFGLYRLNGNYTELGTMLSIVSVSYLIKLMTIGIASPFLTLSKKMIIK